MKKYLLISLLLLMIASTSFSQPVKKPAQKEKPPTQKELNDMMKEMQNTMDNMSPEDKKAIDNLGIKMPNTNPIKKNMEGISDSQLKKAYEDEKRIVPLKNVQRIASISKTPLTNASLRPFLATAHTKVVTSIEQESKIKGEEIYQLINKLYNSPIATGNTAASLLMIGKIELALYIMGKACLDEPENIDNLNNYAAMLSMGGAEQLAIPILEKLNKQFPKNTTLLNNIGQAWFGLGDIDKAEKYLDSTIRIFANHPQANYTKSFIEESKGHKAEAIQSAKRSIKNAFSQEKVNRLNKLKYELKSDDLDWKFHMPQDPLGLEKFKWPDYPANVDQSEILEKEWDAFKKSCGTEIDNLHEKEKNLEAEFESAQQKLTHMLLQAGNKGLMIDPFPRFAYKAFIKLKYLVDGKDGQLANNYQKKIQAIAETAIHNIIYEENLRKELEALNKKYEDKFGEGKENPFAAACADDNKANNTYLGSVNSLMEQNVRDYLNFLRRKINDEVYYYQYTMWPEQFELAKVQAKIAWLNSIKSQGVAFKNKSSWCQAGTGDLGQKPFKLQAFDDVHCEYHSELSTPVGTIRADCSRLTTTLDLKFIKLGLKQDMDKNTFNDQFMNCTVEVGAGVDLGAKNLGPIKAELSVAGAIAVEIDRTGITDVIVKGTAGVSVGTDVINDGSAAGLGVKDLQIEVGVKGQVSIITGKGSIEGTGVLEKGNKK